MLITDEQVKLQTTTGEIIRKHDPDSPPPYEPPSLDPGASSSTSAIYPPLPSDLQPTNFLAVTRGNNSIRGRYLIDTDLDIPASLLAELDDPKGRGGRCRKKRKSKAKNKRKDEERLGAGERPNLKLRGTNGNIAADVWIVGSKGEDDVNAEGQKKRAFVEVKNTNGSVRLQVAADPSSTPFALLASTANGRVTLYIPRTYTGTLTIRKGNGSAKLSPELEARVQTFSDIKGKRVCFVGDFRQAGYGQSQSQGGGEWCGNAIEVGSANGWIRVSYIDDEKRAEGETSVLTFTSRGPGFWSKLHAGWK